MSNFLFSDLLPTWIMLLYLMKTMLKQLFHIIWLFQNGGRIVFATDDWFAVAENLLKVSLVIKIYVK